MGLETVRDMMEAFVIYSFLALVLEYAGGDAACLNKIKNEPPLTHLFPLCCLRPMPRDGRFLRVCKQGTLQFVFIKPVMALVSLAMFSKGLFWSSGYQVGGWVGGWVVFSFFFLLPNSPTHPPTHPPIYLGHPPHHLQPLLFDRVVLPGLVLSRHQRHPEALLSRGQVPCRQSR